VSAKPTGLDRDCRQSGFADRASLRDRCRDSPVRAARSARRASDGSTTSHLAQPVRPSRRSRFVNHQEPGARSALVAAIGNSPKRPRAASPGMLTVHARRCVRADNSRTASPRNNHAPGLLTFTSPGTRTSVCVCTDPALPSPIRPHDPSRTRKFSTRSSVIASSARALGGPSAAAKRWATISTNARPGRDFCGW